MKVSPKKANEIIKKILGYIPKEMEENQESEYLQEYEEMEE